MRTIKALFLDIDDTLYSTSEFAVAARRAAMDAMIRHGLKMRLEDAMTELGEVISEFGSNYPHHYDRFLRRLPASAINGRARMLAVINAKGPRPRNATACKPSEN